MARAPHFLRPLVNAAPAGLCLRNQRTGQVLATTLLPALDSATRKTGLLKHTSLADGEAMLIAPSNAVHTWFMKFDLDLIFVRRDGRVVKTRAAVKPWRMSGGAARVCRDRDARRHPGRARHPARRPPRSRSRVIVGAGFSRPDHRT